MIQGVWVALPFSATALGVRVGVGPPPLHAALRTPRVPSSRIAIVFLTFTFDSHVLSIMDLADS